MRDNVSRCRQCHHFQPLQNQYIRLIGFEGASHFKSATVNNLVLATHTILSEDSREEFSVHRLIGNVDRSILKHLQITLRE